MRIALILLVTGGAALVVDCAPNATTAGVKEDANEDSGQIDMEPPFPHIFNPQQMGRMQQIHIVSETVSEKLGYRTIGEYFDFEAARSTIIETQSGGETRTTYIDSVADLIFSYKPYTCKFLFPNELEAMPGFDDGIWDSSLELPRNEEGSGKPIKMRLYGVVGLWYNFGQKEKSYKLVDDIYIASQDLKKEVHRWTAVKDDIAIHFHFHAFDEHDTSSFSLEMIQIESISTKKIVKSINIMSIDTFPSDLDANILQVPLGYGCVDPKIPERRDIRPTLDSLYSNNPERIELEMTAIKYDYDENGHATQKGDTIGVEVARRTIHVGENSGLLKFFRQRDSNSDIKLITNQLFNVLYKIDVRKGTCEMSNLGAKKKKNEDTGEATSISFSNGLRLALDGKEGDLFQKLFIDTDKFQFIKSVKDDQGDEFMYYEWQSVFGRATRMIRQMSKNSYGVADLESVSLWIYNDDYSRVLETYQINIIDEEDFDSQIDLAKQFDVSEECYLNSDKMKANRDYAWFKLTYSSPIHLLETISDHTDEIKQQFYTQLYEDIDFFRAPKMELLFEEAGLVLRLLILDLPPVYLQYEQRDENKLVIEKGSSDLEELAVDIEHCSELCRLNQCKSMSYCKDHTCSISFQLADSLSKVKLDQNPDCTTYVKQATSVTLDASRLSLHSILNTMRFEDYDSVVLPKLPDELACRMQETGLDWAGYRKVALNYYYNTVQAILAQRHEKFLRLFYYLTEEGFILMLANKFQVESDPLNDFGLADKGLSLRNNDLDDEFDGVPAFHQGLRMHRYKTPVFKDDGGNERMMQAFSDLNYDQCALACVDSSCDSFSYCEHSKECVITNIYDIANVTQDLIVTDIDCFIDQRDYLSKFYKFQGVYMPFVSKNSHIVQNAAECAHRCIIDKEGCLAFDICSTKEDKRCYMVKDRVVYSRGVDGADSKQTGDVKECDDRGNGRCDHYSRSYLADFLKIHYRQIEETALANLETTPYDGRTVDQCADSCATQMHDCTAFQFCFDAFASGAKQKCTLIEGGPSDSNKADFEVSVNETDGKISKTGKIFQKSADCHVFVLKPTSLEARHRDLAIEIENGGQTQEIEQATGSGLSLVAGLVLFISMTILSAGIACGLFVYKDRNKFIRQKIERAQILLRLPVY